MNTKVNFHTHTNRCKHAEGTEKDYILKAIDNGLSKLGFSDHAPYPDNRFGLRMDYCELTDYINTLRLFQNDFKDKLDISIGLEIEYDPNSHNYYDYLKKELNIEYFALGQHILWNGSEFINTYFFNDTTDYITYANSINDALDTGYFSFVAHPDLIFINDLPWDSNCEKACNIIINAAIKNNSILEFNANGLRRGLTTYSDGTRYPYPHKKFWDKVAQTNIKVIVNSDCHDPNQVWDESMDEAHKLAENLNLNVIYNL